MRPMTRYLLSFVLMGVACIRADAQTPQSPLAPLPSAGDMWKYRQTKPGQQVGREHVVQVRSAAAGKIVDDTMVAGQAPVEAEHRSGAYLISQGVSLFSPYLNVLGPVASTVRA